MFGRPNRNESGAIVVNGQHVGSTLQCVHCGNHEIIIPGSGRKRGMCQNCGGFLCGRKPCMVVCVPHEARIEYEEALNQERHDLIKRLVSRYPGIKDITFQT